LCEKGHFRAAVFRQIGGFAILADLPVVIGRKLVFGQNGKLSAPILAQNGELGAENGEFPLEILPLPLGNGQAAESSSGFSHRRWAKARLRYSGSMTVG
jgi:hypothetical protein